MPRAPFRAGADFDTLTTRALGFIGRAPGVHGRLLALLGDCHAPRSGEEGLRGASYKRLAAAAYAVGMSKEERVRWYRLAEDVPLSDHHVGHILRQLEKRA